ncbi:hypothetical protein ACFVUS_27335 [Nocardia sp. NPDC058058]|uniref:hypothetical protein n=1 Tax=Nocardia sp. NPDC058058 TaxID=3346317 RepID=UPI0036DDD546
MAKYLTEAARERAGAEYRYRGGTFTVWLAAIGERHMSAGYPHPGIDPLIVEAMRKIRGRRTGETGPARAPEPLTRAHLEILVTDIQARARGWIAQVTARRDIALLTMGFGGGLHRDELARLALHDVAPVGAGERLAVRLGQPDSGSIEYTYLSRPESAHLCPWCAYLRWLAVIITYDSAVQQTLHTARSEADNGTIANWEAMRENAADDGATAVIRLIHTATDDLEQHICDDPRPSAPTPDAPLFRAVRNGLPYENSSLTAGSITRIVNQRAIAAALDPSAIDLFGTRIRHPRTELVPGVTAEMPMHEPNSAPHFVWASTRRPADHRHPPERVSDPVAPQRGVSPEYPSVDRRPPLGLPTRYQRPWVLFARWCAATDHAPLPASPLTVAAFLDDHPGSRATHRTRLTAINQAHLVADLPAPGRAATLRTALNELRSERGERIAARVNSIVRQLPTRGWTRGLFGRRNAALLTLSAAGLTYTQIADLVQGDLTLADDHAIIADGLASLAVTGDPDTCPVAILRRWTDVVRLAPHPAGRGLLEHHLSRNTLPTDGFDPAHANLPLFTSFDARGYTAMDDNLTTWLRPLSATSIATIVAAHLTGPLPVYRTRATVPVRDRPSAPPVSEPIELEDTFAAGVAARHRDHQRLNDVGSLWDDFDDRADEVTRMLERALAIADGTHQPGA